MIYIGIAYSWLKDKWRSLMSSTRRAPRLDAMLAITITLPPPPPMSFTLKVQRDGPTISSPLSGKSKRKLLLGSEIFSPVDRSPMSPQRTTLRFSLPPVKPKEPEPNVILCEGGGGGGAGGEAIGLSPDDILFAGSLITTMDAIRANAIIASTIQTDRIRLPNPGDIGFDPSTNRYYLWVVRGLETVRVPLVSELERFALNPRPLAPLAAALNQLSEAARGATISSAELIRLFERLDLIDPDASQPTDQAST
jgi:hypothetical protein